MEKFVNDVAFRLGNKMDPANINLVKSILYIVIKDYDIAEKSTEVAVVDNDLPKEAKIYLVSRKIDGLAEGTIIQYKRIIETLFEEVHKPIPEITTEDLRVFFYQMQSRQISNRTLDTYRAYLMAMFTWLCVNEYIVKNPMMPIKPFKYERKSKKALTDMELEKIRKVCKDALDVAIIEVLYSTACRVSELVEIKLEDINFDAKEIEIRHGKGNKARTTYLNAKAILAINEYIKDRDYPSVYLFESYRKPHNQLCKRRIQEICKRLSDDSKIKIHPHKMKRTTATHLLQKGMPLEEIKELLGHEDISTTLIYANINQDNVKYNHKKYL